jgi:ribosomal protein S18 acetylase RimI-like enzyme
VFDVRGQDRPRLSLRKISSSWTKDYDLIEAPATWPDVFDVSRWAIFTAHQDGKRVGGAVAVHNTPELDMLEGRSDLAVLWDIRIAPDARRSGIGSALMHHVEAWARQNLCREMKVETQNINVPACSFYMRHGFALRAANYSAYPQFPDEVQLLWYKDLA